MHRDARTVSGPIDWIRSSPTGRNSPYNGLNPKRISYMDFHQNATEYVDPWGRKYRVLFDTDYDGDVNTPDGDLRMSVAAWSAGEDGVDGTEDDVRTWR